MPESSAQQPGENGVPIQQVVEELTLERSAVASLRAESAQLSMSAVARLQADKVTGRLSAAALCRAETIEFDRSSVGLALSKDSASVSQGMSRVVAAGHNADLHMSAAGAVLAGKTARLRTAGAGIVAAPQVTVDRGWIGLLLAGKADLTDTKVMVRPGGAAAVAAAFGAALAVGLAVLRPRKK
jgi:hypothetical protein